MKIKILCCLNLFCSTLALSMQYQHAIHALALKLITERFTLGSIIRIPENKRVQHVLKDFIFTIKKVRAETPVLEIAVHTPESVSLVHGMICPLLPHAISSASFTYNNQEFTASVSPIVLETRSKSPSPY